MIDRIIIPNLKRREDRWYFALGALRALGFNIERENYIIRFNAHDAKDYRNTELLIEAAVDDGFAFFTRYMEERVSPAVLAWHWTWNDIMRTIAEMPENTTVLFMIDDSYPLEAYSARRLNRIVEEARRLTEGEFYAIQLNVSINPIKYRSPSLYLNSSMLLPGLIGHDDLAFILSPLGAKIFMNTFREIQPIPRVIHDVIETIANRGVNDDKFYKGFWHTAEHVFGNMGHFFGSDLTQAKGIDSEH